MFILIPFFILTVVAIWIQALGLYQAAAANGHAMAQYNLGVFHLFGRGDTVVDPTKALDLISQAADQGITQVR